MTTIAYDGVSVCADGRIVYNDVITSDEYNKTLKNDQGDLFFVAGDATVAERFVKEFKDFEYSAFDFDISAIVIKNNKVYHVGTCSEGGRFRFWSMDVRGMKFAIGSGAQFAKAAMDFGMDSVDAIKAANKRCIYTGQPYVKCDVASGVIEVLTKGANGF